MKHSTTPALKECHSVGASLCSLHVPTGFVGRAGSEVSVAHIFPWDLLVIITLMGGETDVGETRDRTRCENGLLFYSVAVSALPGVNWCQKCWNRSPESKGKIGYTPLDAWCPSNGNFDLVDNSTGATEAKSGPWCDQGVHCNSPRKPVRVPGSSPSVASMWELSTTAFAISGLSWLCSLYLCTLSLATLVFTIVESCARAREDGAYAEAGLVSHMELQSFPWVDPHACYSPTLCSVTAKVVSSDTISSPQRLTRFCVNISLQLWL